VYPRPWRASHAAAEVEAMRRRGYRDEMALRLLRLVNKWFALAAFWTYLAAVALAFTMVIVFFPVGALALLFAGLLTLPVVVAISTGMSWWERAWCRRWLRSARCPCCLESQAVHGTGAGEIGAGSASTAVNDDEPWRTFEIPRYECRRCGAFFDATGAEAEAPLTA